MKGNIFIRRPAMAVSISVMLLIVGVVSLAGLPVEQYPDIAPPAVQVSATYTGASADAVQKSVVIPLEENINGVENMLYMTSTATNQGQATITVYFRQGTNPDMAAVNVQNRVSKAQGLLPAEVTRIGVTTQKQQNSLLYIPILYSPDGRYDKQFLDNYMDINVVPRLKRINGVADVLFFGNVYSLRIWLKPDVMAQYGLVPADIAEVLDEQNIESPTGAFGENSDNTFQYTMSYKGRLSDVGEFEDMVIRSLPDGNVLRVGDVAVVELGWQAYTYESVMNGLPSCPIRLFQVAGANATEVNNEISATLEEISKELPEGMKIATILNSNEFLFASIHEVVLTLVIAIVLVVLVVYFFLHDFRSTLIPSLSIVVSLVGTFACLAVAGFSVNLLTLFALVLAIGTVVDDAIVVVEAVHARFDAGYRSPYLATRDAMGDVTMAIVTCSLVFMAVFVPVTFMGGTSGTFYTQFGVTMAAAVGLSCLNSLTLCPALCALWLRPADGMRSANGLNARVRRAYEASFSVLLGKYRRGILFFFRRRTLAWAALGLGIAAFAVLARTTKTGFVPQEDMGMLYLNITASPGNTLAQTRKVAQQVDSILTATPEVEYFGRVIGNGILAGQGVSYGSAFVRLYHWDHRKGKEHSAAAVVTRLNKAFAGIRDAQVFCFQQAMIPGYGTGNTIELNVQDLAGGELKDLFDVTNRFLAGLNRRPEVAMAYTAFNMNFPQYRVDVDAARCKRAGISPADVLNTLGGYCGGTYASDFNRFSKMYRVMVQAAPEYRLDERALDNMFVRVNGGMAPLSQFVTLERVQGAEIINRFNLFSSILASVNVADGYSSGQVQQAIAEVASQTLPAGYGYEYGGMAREEAGGTDKTFLVYLFCVVFIYLILVCLYESFLVPFAVILSVPCGLAGSFLFARLCGLENNIYLQTGVIMLIGLLAKTAILITEYASERRRKGMGIVEAAYSAAVARFRPILMTVLAMIFGMLPLVFASGAGANGNNTLGTGVVGGMLVGTLALLFIVPTMFVVFEYLQEKLHPALKDMKQIIAFTLLAVLLGGCGIYRNYERPAGIVTDGLYGTEATDSVSLGDLSWRDFFTDPVLQTLIEEGLANNTDLRVAELQIAEAEASLKAARLAFLPSLDFSPQGSLGGFAWSGTTRAYTLPVMATWQVDVFGSLRNAKKRTRMQLEQSLAYRQAVQAHLVSSIANHYYTLAMLDAQLRVSEETAGSWKRGVEMTRALMAVGEETDAAVSQSEANYYEVCTQVVELKRQIREVENSFSALLGRMPGSIRRGMLDGWEAPGTVSTGIPARLLSRRPDVRQAELALAAAFYATGEARAAFYPALTLSGQLGWSNNDGQVNPGNWIWQALASLTQPLFRNGQLRAQLAASKARQEEAGLAFRQALLDAGAEVNTALAAIQSSEAKGELYRLRISALQRAVKSTQLLMLNTSANYLQVLTARQDLLAAQLADIGNRFDGIQGTIELYLALGGGSE